MTGVVFDIKECSVHDGAGMRITVFLKGCALRCKWCHNPEGLKREPELLYKRNKCVHCGRCEYPCTHEACQKYGRCIYVCLKNCLQICGKRYTSETLAKKIFSYKAIFDACGGGVTFSGGEPLLQHCFLFEVISKLKGIDIAIETAGYCDEKIFRAAVEKADTVIMDIKLFDREAHKRYTGVYNDAIKRNFRILRESGKPYLIRTPLIAGITDTEENLSAIKQFIGDSPWEILPENMLARVKYDYLSEE